MDRQDAFKGLKVNYLPKLMFKEKMTLGTGADRIDLYYFGAGHTNGDAWVVFPAQRVAHAGDMLGARQPPPIDLDNGGSGLAYPDTLARAAAALKNIDTIIPGHGSLMTMRDLGEYARFCRDFRDAIVSGFGHGLSISETAESWKVPPAKYVGYTAPAERTASGARAIFGELTR
jgi:glyoxylase-like metal-dependent hydrolase (beta-lactamase superfamily II)